MKQKWISILKGLVSPIALGIYITLTFVWICFTYYASKDVGLKGNLLVQGILRAHEISIDYRLLARGPVKATAPVALLTMDEKSLETLGRWPLPRSLMAKIVDKAMADGAKVLGFDIIFAEEEVNQLLQASDDLYQQGVIQQDLHQKMRERALLQDGDLRLSQVFDKHRSHIVGGNYYQYYEDQILPEGHVDYCQDMAFKLTQDFQIWDQEEILVSVQDPFMPSPPYVLHEHFVQELKTHREQLFQSMSKDLDAHESAQLAGKVESAMNLYCQTFFDQAKKKFNSIWASQITSQTNPAEFKYQSYSEWLDDFKSKMKSSGIPLVEGWDLNTPQIAQNLNHNGYFNAHQDSDGTIRSSALIARSGYFTFPSLALKSYLVGTNRNASVSLSYNPATSRKDVSKFEITDNNTGEVVAQIPTDGQGKLLINYAGPQKMFPHLSFADLLSESKEVTIQQRVYDKASKEWIVKELKVNRKEFMKDKYFLVGATATGIFDLRVTPFEKKTYPGLETHANVLANLIEQNFLKPWEDERSQMPFFLLVLGLTHTLLLSQLGALGGMGITFVFLAGVLGVDKYALFDQGLVVTIVWPLLLVLTTYLFLTAYRYLTEERGKKELRATFQKYVSPSIVEEILSDPKNIELGGKKMHLTVFFSDVRGFTTISEKLDPHALSQLLNQYLTPMTEIVFENQGTLDKYMGDAVMAFFGAPIPIEKHAHFACRAALKSLDKLFELQKEFAEKGLPQIDIGIGLNSGEVSAGNMGSKTVRSYTVMGDAVNLASRLEGINKEYGTRIVISEFTYDLVKDHFTAREIDWVRVKGKMKPVKIYELLKEGALTGSELEHFKIYCQGYEHYRQQKWYEAQELFSRALDLNPNDFVSQLFLSRCANYIDSPPDTGWDGVFDMKTK